MTSPLLPMTLKKKLKDLTGIDLEHESDLINYLKAMETSIYSLQNKVNEYEELLTKKEEELEDLKKKEKSSYIAEVIHTMLKNGDVEVSFKIKGDV